MFGKSWLIPAVIVTLEVKLEIWLHGHEISQRRLGSLLIDTCLPVEQCAVKSEE